MSFMTTNNNGNGNGNNHEQVKQLQEQIIGLALHYDNAASLVAALPVDQFDEQYHLLLSALREAKADGQRLTRVWFKSFLNRQQVIPQTIAAKITMYDRCQMMMANKPEGNIHAYLKDLETIQQRRQIIGKARAKEITVQQAKRILSSPANSSPPAEPQFISASDVEPTPIKWLWEHRIPYGMPTLIVGAPDVGKSIWATDVIARLSTGAAFPFNDTATAKGATVIFSENRPVDIRRRLDAASADHSQVYIFNNSNQCDLASNLDTLTHFIDTHPDVRLVVIDTLGAFSGIKDFSDYAAVYKVMNTINAFIRSCESKGRDMALIAITHKPKNSTNREAIYSAIGSVGFSGGMQYGQLIMYDSNNREKRLMAQMKSNFGKKQPTLAYTIVDGINGEGRVQWLGMDDRTADELVMGGSSSPKLDEAVEFLKDCLKDGEKPSEVVIAAAARRGIAKDTLFRAKVAANVIASRKGFGVGGEWHWRIDRAASAASAASAADTVDTIHNNDNGDDNGSPF